MEEEEEELHHQQQQHLRPPCSAVREEDAAAAAMIMVLVDRPRNPDPALVEDDDDGDEDEEDDWCYYERSKRVCWGREFHDEEEQEEDNQLAAADHQRLTTTIVVKPIPVRLHQWDYDNNNSHRDDSTRDEYGYTTSDDDGCSAHASYHRAAGPNSNRSSAGSNNSGIPRCAIFPASSPSSSTTALQAARDGLLLALSAAGGSTDGPDFRHCLSVLHEHYRRSGFDARTATQAFAGTWLALTRPVFADCLGDNDRGDPLYTLARMSFGMFRPSNLVCSLQGNFNCIEPTTVDGVPPSVLRDEIPSDDEARASSSFCTYDTVCAFTLEPTTAPSHWPPNDDRDAPPVVHRACRGILSTHGYTVADPHTPNRHTVWIASGSLQSNDAAEDAERWNDFFSSSQAGVENNMCGGDEQCNSNNFRQSYAFRRALGGPGRAHVDTLYLDRSLRVVRGHRGTLFVFARMSGGGGGSGGAGN